MQWVECVGHTYRVIVYSGFELMAAELRELHGNGDSVSCICKF